MPSLVHLTIDVTCSGLSRGACTDDCTACCTIPLKELSYAGLAKRQYLAWIFMSFFCSINFCFGHFDIRRFMTNCNSCLYHLSKLQKEFIFFLNSERYRTMLQDSFSEHPDPPMLQSLQWLPIEQRMEYKLSLLCFKIIFHQAPIYLSELLHLCTPSWQLRSFADTRVFRIPSFRTKSSGQRSFSY